MFQRLKFKLLMYFKCYRITLFLNSDKTHICKYPSIPTQVLFDIYIFIVYILLWSSLNRNEFERIILSNILNVLTNSESYVGSYTGAFIVFSASVLNKSFYTAVHFRKENQEHQIDT